MNKKTILPIIILCPFAMSTEGCADNDTQSKASMAEDVLLKGPVKCDLINPFSLESECKQYIGAGWTASSAQADCEAGQYSQQAQPGVFSEGTCSLESLLGTCRVESDPQSAFSLALGGNNPDFCSTTARACVNFIGGSFETAEVCAGQYVDTPPVGSEPLVFQWPTQSCVPPLDGEEPGQGENGEVCTWNLISGCTEEGREFFEYGSCETVWTNRPYYPVPGRAVSGDDDPRLQDANFLAESAWVKSQVEACACVCCHTERSPEGPSKWSVDAGPLWTDTMSDTAISLFAGYVDSSALGAFKPEDNNGFDRLNSALPTTDVNRMTAFFQREFERRNIDVEFAESIRPIGGPLVEQQNFVPEFCPDGSGIDLDGRLTWTDDRTARYVYVLDWNAQNPGIPPNFDLPEGTKWRIDVDHNDEPLQSGEITYGIVPGGARQYFPRNRQVPETLVPGQNYYLYVLNDIAVVVERCLFVAP